MTNKLNNAWVRGIFSLIIGVLLVVYPSAASVYFVMAVGVLFFIPGAVSLSAFLMRRADGRMFPFMGLGSLLFGLWLLITPAFFVGILMYVLGAVLVLAGLGMLVNLSAIRKRAPVAVVFYVVPVLVIVGGILVLVNPFRAAELPFIILGVSSIIYALSSMLNAYKFRAVTIEAVEIIEEGPSAEEHSEAEASEVKEVEGEADVKLLEKPEHRDTSL